MNRWIVSITIIILVLTWFAWWIDRHPHAHPRTVLLITFLISAGIGAIWVSLIISQ